MLTPKTLGLFSGNRVRQATLFAALAAALAGLFLLAEFIVTLTSGGTRDPLAVTASSEPTLGVPNGVGLVELLILAVSIVLAAALLVAGIGWPPRQTSLPTRWPLALSVAAAIALVAAGSYLAFSGILSGSISYESHQVQRTDLDAGNLIVIAALFLSVTIAGLINWRFFTASLLAWLVAFAVFGFVDSQSVSGLLLFPRTDPQGLPGDFGATVRSIQEPEAATAGQPTDGDPTLLSQVTAQRRVPPVDEPVFQVTGAAHTRYLRTDTGDSYRNGTWQRLERNSVTLAPNQPVAEALGPMAAQLHLPTESPLHEWVEQIAIAPVEGVASLPAGVLVAPANLRSIDTAATYFPFSETLASQDALGGYELQSAVSLYALNQKLSAAPVADPAYLQLPDALPSRVHALADQVTEDASSPYLAARLLQVHLQEEYTYRPGGSAARARPPAGGDPVDWFLFERRSGTASNFSSAFVVLARAAGVPARAVSGWVVATRPETQTVFRRQSHQWAEIALDGVGWVTVDPFPADAFTSGDVDHAWSTALGELAASASTQVRNAVPTLRDAADDPELLQQLLEAVDTVSARPVKQAAQTVLSTFTLDNFITLLSEHEDPDVREASAYALEVIANPEALSALVEALANDDIAQVRAAAASALGVVGKGGAEDALIAALGSDASAEVRAAVAGALGEITDNSSLLPLLEARADDPSPQVRAASASALKEWDAEALLQILSSDAATQLRVAAVLLLGEGGFAEAIAPLGRALSDTAIDVRAAARTALEAIGEVTWLESGGGVILHQGNLAFLPYVTPENNGVAAPAPVFRVRGSANTSLLRTSVGDIYAGGEWYPGDQRLLSAGVEGIAFRPFDIRPRLPDNAGNLNNIYLSGIGFDQLILAGVVPTSLHAQAFTVPVSYQVPGHTVFARSGHARYGWDAIVYQHTPEQLNAAAVWPVAADSVHLQLPRRPVWVDQARELAMEITAGHTTPYAKASAIEQHLISQYQYRPVEPPVIAASARQGPSRQDPVAEFLFDTRQGTAGPLSSAFVILARSLGIPARVVSGWAVDDTSRSQVVFTDQKHQWAEVALAGLGWVTFDPAPDGAPSRVRKGLREVYEQLGAEVTPLETGGALIELDDETFLTRSTTTRQSQAPPSQALFRVTGAAHTGYLRTAVGEIYDGAWSELEPAALSYAAGDDILGATRELYDRLRTETGSVLADRLASLSLLGFRQDPTQVNTDLIGVLRAQGSDALPHGAVPTSLDLQRKDLNGFFDPFSATFSTRTQALEYAWTSDVAVFSEQQYNAAPVARAAAYTALPKDLPQDIARLARQVTARHATAYAKAVALERYLKANYEYAFADAASNGTGGDQIPAGRDPVEWFLFDSRRGTAGQFSSAFAVLARSVGIPARVVAGFVVSPTPQPQEVHADQAHQWAEIALDGVGWVRFDPVAPGGAPGRVPGASPEVRTLDSSDPTETEEPTPIDTITDITEAPEEIRRLTPFVVAGTVQAASDADGAAPDDAGTDVTGMTVEIYINETKEHGGTKIGVTTSRSGNYRAVAQLPADMELGDYQLLARAVGNSLFNESWSDPDVQVFSGNKIELSGPATIDRNAPAVFNGRITDDSEDGVAGRQIDVRFDGVSVRPVLTDAEGRFSFSRAFSELGEHTVEVQLQGEELLLDNTAFLRFEVMQPTQLAVYAPDYTTLGETFVVTGELREADGPPLRQGQVELEIERADGPEIVTVDITSDGEFSYTTRPFEGTGRYTLTARYRGADSVRGADAEVAFAVLRPTELTLDAPAAVRDGERFTVEGTLREADGQPVSNATVTVPGAVPPSPVTGADGRFAVEVPAVFDASQADDPANLSESTLRVTASFDATTELAASDAAVSVVVGVPRILVEPLEAVTRGTDVTLRGAVLVEANRPVPGARLTVGTDTAFESNDAGAFSFTYRVRPDAPVGLDEIVIEAAALDATAAVPLMVKSASTLVVTPVGRVRPGNTATLQVTLLDDTGAAITGAQVQSSAGVAATTDSSGVAVLELAVPQADALVGSRVEFAYAGDDLRAGGAITYFWAGAITPGGVNWRLWAGAAAATALAAAVAFAFSRFVVQPLLLRRRARRVGADVATLPEEADEINDSEDCDDDAETDSAEQDDGEAVEAVTAVDDLTDSVAAVVPTVELRIDFEKTADDLADVWGVGETLPISVSVTDDGLAVSGAVVAVALGAISLTDGAPSSPSLQSELAQSELAQSELTADDDGFCAFEWSCEDLGEYVVSAEFAVRPLANPDPDSPNADSPNADSPESDDLGNGVTDDVDTGRQDIAGSQRAGFDGVISQSRGFRVVEFRSEIVRLYGFFSEWAMEQGVGVSEVSTPREARDLLMSQAHPPSQPALNQLIFRFEEADYSEHAIERRHYEAMYRALNAVMTPDQLTQRQAQRSDEGINESDAVVGQANGAEH